MHVPDDGELTLPIPARRVDMRQPTGPEDTASVVAVREIVPVGDENAFLAAREKSSRSRTFLAPQAAGRTTHVETKLCVGAVAHDVV